MNRLAHAAEDLVGQLRDGSRHPDRATIDALLAALDGLRALLDAASQAARSGPVKNGVAITTPIEPLLSRLRAPAAVPAGDPAHHDAAPATTAAAAPRTGDRDRHTLRVDFDKLDTLLNLVGELVLGKSRLGGNLSSFGALVRELDAALRRARAGRSPLSGDDLERFQRLFAALAGDLDDVAGDLDHVSADLRQQVMKLRMLPVGRVFNKYHRTVRELANQLGKRARLEVRGAETELDKVLLEQLDEPLLHLVRNALDHGVEMPALRAGQGKPEEGVLLLSAEHRGNQIVIEVADDGAGIDPGKLRKKALEKSLADPAELAAMDERQMLDLIFRPGFSTAARVTDLSGRGVGMDVVRESIQRLSGSIELSSAPQRGTTFTLKLPLTLAIIQVLLVRVAGQDLALPLDMVTRSLYVGNDELQPLHSQEVLYLDDDVQIPVVDVAHALELPPSVREGEVPVVLVRVAGEIFGLVVERLVEKREIVLKGLGELIDTLPCVAGATLVGDQVVLVADLPQLVQRGLQRAARAPQRTTTVTPVAATTSKKPRVLLAEDSDTMREGLRRMYESHGCEVLAARDGGEALAIAEREESFDLVSTDVMMPILDGYELTRALRAHPRHKDVPIVMVTSRAEQLDRVRGFDAGVDEYITKPLEAGELLRAIERHVSALSRRSGA
jgi:two-component system chemotaxis sensor kinase CheA